MSSYNFDVTPFIPQSYTVGKGNGNEGTDRANSDGNQRGNGRGGSNKHNNNRGRGRSHRGRGNKQNGRGGSSKNYYNNNNNNEMDQETRSLIAEQELFSNSVRNKRGEADISHLLNFTSHRPQRSHQSHRRPPPPRPPQRRNNNNQKSQEHNSLPPADKETYVNISCKFVVDPRGDYKELLTNPDKNVPMGNVIRIISQPSSCPICLEDIPEAPRMLQCGHIMCCPCLHRFMSSDDIQPVGDTKPKKYKECPLCFDRVRWERTKPVSFAPVNELFDAPKEDQDVVLRLMFRPMGSCIAVPADTDGLKKEMFDDLPDANMSDISRYSRLIKGSKNYTMEEYDREILQLQKSKEENALMFDDNGLYYDKAIQQIKNTQRIINDSDSVSSNNKPTENTDTTTNNQINYETSLPSTMWDAPENSTEQITNQLADTSISQTRHQDHSLVSRYSDESAYFFYQAGFDCVTKYFLAPLDVKILRAAYGAFCAFPPTLLLKVTNITHGQQVTRELRKRIKYLNHLPLYTPIAFLECEWRGIVPDESLKPFNKDLSSRRKWKKDKERREERDKRRYEREEQEHLRAELEQEDYYTPVIATPKVNSAPRKELPLAAPPTSTPDQQESSTSTEGPASFASIASGEAQSGQDIQELENLLSSAPKKGKGKKRLVLLSSNNNK